MLLLIIIFAVDIISLIHRILQTLSRLYLGLRVTVHTQPLNALEGVICEVELGAAANIQPTDALEMCKHITSQLSAPTQAQAVNALDVDKCGIRDGKLAAISHVQSVDTLEVHKGSKP